MLNLNSAANATFTQAEDQPQYLTDYSPSDRPWDVHRAQAQQVEGVYSGTIFDRLAGRIRDCANYLGFVWQADPSTGEALLKLREARFCRVRHCPVCQWRRSLMWQARFLKALPAIEQAYPTARWLFLTLTVRNVPVTELRSQIRSMSEAWRRFVLRPEFASNVQGWIRTTEVTRGRDGSAHPHFHVLLMVRPSYFKKHYVKHDRWTELWQECARLDYRPSVRIQTVKPKPGSTEFPLRRAVSETLKYSVKPEDMMDREWLIELTKQVHRLRFIASGGVLKDMLREAEETERDLLLADDGEDGEGEPELFFDWQRGIKRYTRRRKAFFCREAAPSYHSLSPSQPVSVRNDHRDGRRKLPQTSSPAGRFVQLDAGRKATKRKATKAVLRSQWLPASQDKLQGSEEKVLAGGCPARGVDTFGAERPSSAAKRPLVTILLAHPSPSLCEAITETGAGNCLRHPVQRGVSFSSMPDEKRRNEKRRKPF